ncbi:MAG: YtxH domain-containing protein [Thermomicrobiales bacterium]
MGIDGKIVALGKGGVLGVAIGAITAIFLAPKSGEQLQLDVNERLQQAKIAGERAKATKKDELITRFRQSVDSPTALEQERIALHQTSADQVAAVVLES